MWKRDACNTRHFKRSALLAQSLLPWKKCCYRGNEQSLHGVRFQRKLRRVNFYLCTGTQEHGVVRVKDFCLSYERALQYTRETMQRLFVAVIDTSERY